MQAFLTKYGWWVAAVLFFLGWLAIALIFQRPIVSLLLVSGYFAGRARCASQVLELEEKNWKLRLRLEEVTDIMNDTVDRLHDHNGTTTIDTDTVQLHAGTVNIVQDDESS